MTASNRPRSCAIRIGVINVLPFPSWIVCGLRPCCRRSPARSRREPATGVRDADDGGHVLLPGEDGEVREHAAGFRDQPTEPADDGRQSRIERAHHEDRPGRDRAVGVVYDRTNGSAASCTPSAEATSVGPLLLWGDLAVARRGGTRAVPARRPVRRHETGGRQGSAAPPPTTASSSARVRWAMHDSGSRDASTNRRSNSVTTRAVSSCTSGTTVGRASRVTSSSMPCATTTSSSEQSGAVGNGRPPIRGGRSPSVIGWRARISPSARPSARPCRSNEVADAASDAPVSSGNRMADSIWCACRLTSTAHARRSSAISCASSCSPSGPIIESSAAVRWPRRCAAFGRVPRSAPTRHAARTCRYAGSGASERHPPRRSASPMRSRSHTAHPSTEVSDGGGSQPSLGGHPEQCHHLANGVADGREPEVELEPPER